MQITRPASGMIVRAKETKSEGFLTQAAQTLPVRPSPLRIEKPAPLVKIFDGAADMDPHHPAVLVRRLLVRMDNRNLRIIHRLIRRMHPSGEVDILAIHKKAFIEQPDFPKSRYTQKHETP